MVDPLNRELFGFTSSIITSVFKNITWYTIHIFKIKNYRNAYFLCGSTNILEYMEIYLRYI